MYIPRTYNSHRYDTSPEAAALWAAQSAQSIRLVRHNYHIHTDAYALGWERGVAAVVRMFLSLAKP